ncbi:hypothetical protein RST01_24380 [Rummeliibacillus stabekisii]|uniref:Uncharacterized protein n=2 Tax=Caryophanaceae TaxID=186818 RepID=A0A143HEM0_9BACL|nr:hypothetical protein ATY39_12685 [Rummeliibacillus stabekisii]GEL05811.1 hypothetical protein RST01_24380 [Rummeliibacillus stabekisii]
MNMGKSKSLLLAGLAAGAYAYFRKKENRDKAMEAFNSTKDKVNEFVDKNFSSSPDVKEDAVRTTTGDGHTDPELTYDEEDSKMTYEGSTMTSINYENAEQDDKLNGVKPPEENK